MKKIFLIVAVLMLATSALAVPPDVNVWAEQGDDANKVEIWYEVVPPITDCNDGNRPRAFGLNISVTDGNIIAVEDYFEGECNDTNKGYGIFPGNITIVDGNVTNYGTSGYNPVAPDDAPGAEDTGIDTNTVVLEMGSLYTGANCPDPCAMLCTLTVSLDCNVSIVGNAARTGTGSPAKGVVLENLAEVVANFPEQPFQVQNVSRFVPDVCGLLLADANDAIEANDLVVGTITWVCGNMIASAGEVTMTDPEALTEVPQGTEVDLWVSLGDCDYGDANDPPYPTLLANDGARHIATGVILGVLRDTETDGQPNATATGDDNDGTDDEDGITLLVITPVGGFVTVTVTADCNLNAWVDFNDNGDWNDPGEQIFTDEPLLVAGSPHPLLFAVPAYAVRETDLVSRWRVNYAGGLTYTGRADDGEVEDHLTEVVCHVPDVVNDVNAAAQAEIIANGFAVNVIGECNDVIPDGNVTRTVPAYCNYPDCDSVVDIYVSTGPCVAECYAGRPDYAVWEDVNKPECWCYLRQCHGDVDGKWQGGTATGYYFIGTDDLNVLTTVWKVLEDCAAMWPGQPAKCEQWPGGLPTPSGPGIETVTGPAPEYVPGGCADISHSWQGGTATGYYYVGTDDLNVVTTKWKVLEDCAAMWPGQPAKCEQWPGGPPTPSGSGVDPNCLPGNRTP